MSVPTAEPLVTVVQLATHLNVTTRTLWRWRNDGMPHYMQGSTVRFRVSEVEAWMRDNGPDHDAEQTGAAA